MDPARPAAAALLVDGDRIAAVLDDPADAPRGAERFDLAGGCALPGFTDAHVHFPSWALSRRELALLEAGSLGEAVALVAAAAPSPGGWIRGRGWRDELWPDGERPDRHALDAVVRDRPVALRAHDSHSLWLNSAALALAGGDLETPGGVVERDAGGEPTGILREEAAWRYEARFAPEPRRRSTPCAPRCRRSPRRASSPSTTRTAGRARPRCSPRPGSRSACGSPCPRTPGRSRAGTTSRRSWTARSARAPPGCSTARAWRSPPPASSRA